MNAKDVCIHVHICPTLSAVFLPSVILWFLPRLFCSFLGKSNLLINSLVLVAKGYTALGIQRVKVSLIFEEYWGDWSSLFNLRTIFIYKGLLFYHFLKIFKFCQVWWRSLHHWLITNRCKNSSWGESIHQGIMRIQVLLIWNYRYIQFS